MDMSLLIIIFPVPNANKYYKEKVWHLSIKRKPYH